MIDRDDQDVHMIPVDQIGGVGGLATTRLPRVFAEVWAEVFEQLEVAPELQAKVLFQWLQQRYPGRFQDGQLRTFQRGVKRWRATQGPPKEVFFAQTHQPGRLCSQLRAMHDI